MTTPATLTDQLVAHAAEALARLDGGELASRFVTEAETPGPVGYDYAPAAVERAAAAVGAAVAGTGTAADAKSALRWARHEVARRGDSGASLRAKVADLSAALATELAAHDGGVA